MKITIFLFAFLFVVSFFLYGKNEPAKVTGVVISKDDFILKIYEPINNFYNMAHFNPTELNGKQLKDKTFSKSFNLNQPAFITIRLTTVKNEFLKAFDLLLFPNDSVYVEINLKEEGTGSVKFKGSNAKGHSLRYQTEYNPYPKYIPIEKHLKLLPENKEVFVSKVNSEAEALINKFVSLKDQSYVTSEYVEYIGFDIKSAFFIFAFRDFIEYKGNIKLGLEDRKKIIADFFKILPATTPKIKGLPFFSIYINHYFNFTTMKKLGLPSISPLIEKDVKLEMNGKKYLINKQLVPLLSIEDKDYKEDLWGLSLLTWLHYTKGLYDSSVIDQYCSLFPSNRWEKALRMQLAKHGKLEKIEY